MNIFLIGYAAIGLLVWRPLAGHIAWLEARHWGQRTPSGEDWFTGALVGLAAAAAWPLIALWAIGGKLPKIGAERKGPAAIPADPYYVRQLERETGIDNG